MQEPAGQDRRRERDEPPDSAVRKQQGIPEPDEAEQRGLHQRILLQAPHRLRPDPAVPRGADLPERVPERRSSENAAERAGRERPEVRAGDAGDLRAGSLLHRDHGPPSAGGKDGAAQADRPGAGDGRAAGGDERLPLSGKKGRPRPGRADVHPDGKTLEDDRRMRMETGELYVKSVEEMRDLFKNVPDAIDRTQEIADRCNVSFEFGVTRLPHYPVPEGETADSMLRRLCGEGMARLYPEAGKEDEPWKRLEYELSVIENMGYVDYFLIVWDFIHYAKSQGIMVGPGRGSGAGSIVAYSLGITMLDPLKYQLLFERFLNPERVTMPDIDVDFCYERRQEVIDYVARKYGADHVSQIITFGTMAAKGVVRDVGQISLPVVA